MTMLDERKAAILRAVVEEYISTAQPVGSGHVASAPGVGVSSATVRNDMAVLEQEGYLRQPHTSAGRVPTEKGYRFFVDALTGPGTLTAPQSMQVRSFFARAHGELETMLHDTSRLLSDLTQYAALVTSPPDDSAVIRSVQLVGLGPRVALLVAVLSTGAVEKRTLDWSEEVGEERLSAASAHLNAHVVGRTLDTVVNAVPESGDATVEMLVTMAQRSLATREDEGPDNVFVGGTARMAGAFDAVDTVREVLGILEQQYVVVSLLRDVVDRGLQVAIGTETGLVPLAECAIVVAPYRIEGDRTGTVAVLGPSRMNYPQALAAVAVVSKRLGSSLSED
jgi:heat-inducible transcriptional repressor